MTTLHDRLEKTVAASGRSRRDISIAAGLAPGTLSDILNNRTRSPSVENVRALARELRVTASWLIEGTGDNRPPGFSEGDLSGWTPPAPSGQRPDLDQTRLARLLAPRAASPATLRLRHAMPGAGLEAGDIVVIDLKTTARQGDIVAVQVIDMESGEAATMLRRYLPPYLAPLGAGGETYLADGARSSIMGPVVASFRAPQIAPPD